MGWWELTAVVLVVLLFLVTLREVWYARGCAIGQVVGGQDTPTPTRQQIAASPASSIG